MTEDHFDCLQVPEFERYTKQQADYQKAQNGSIQHIEARTDQIFDTLGVIRTAQNDIYKTITEINVATLETIQRVADTRAEDITAENKRFTNIDAILKRVEKDNMWADYVKRIPKKVWVILASLTAFLVALFTLLNLLHVL